MLVLIAVAQGKLKIDIIEGEVKIREYQLERNECHTNSLWEGVIRGRREYEEDTKQRDLFK